MNYCLYKFNFITSVHFGGSSGGSNLAGSEETIYGDTLFSALCLEALKLGGESLLDELYELASSGKILLTDLFPFRNEEFFLPKPIINVKSKREHSSKDFMRRKIFKKLKFIPASKFQSYIDYMKGEGNFDAEEIAAEGSFGVSQLVEKVSIKGKDVTEPYHVGVFSFKKDCGLYVIIAYEDKKSLALVDRLLNSLSYTGIGGKVSAGLGKFELDDCIYLDEPYSQSLEALAKLLQLDSCNYFMSLTVSLPTDDELDDVISDSYYNILRRGGFIKSETYSSTPLKKKDIYAFSSGSCFIKPFRGKYMMFPRMVSIQFTDI